MFSNSNLLCLSVLACIVIGFFTVVGVSAETVRDEPVCKAKKMVRDNQKHDSQKENQNKTSIKAARGQARLLHDVLHSTLLTVHRKYYREDEKLPIPSSVLDDVFEEMHESKNIRFRWISVNAEAMNIDHEPKTEFEKRAAEALSSGKKEFEQVEKGIYRRVGVICLPSQCLKCHMPNRRSSATRFAGLIISLPVSEN